eukprot:TRINITY_DN15285_c0_g1_i1.p2 TRINITY_DN15285_c0_g1~~TRINITY_DN15285_c0_g1_i1.p2  ORF type:complete len:119 (+),score=13.24 TRINITY_DN15285_c0_g1_i1:365-721(+)
MLPMIFGSDLIRGLVALMDAPKESLTEPQGGYALAGFSFTPRQLFDKLAERRPGFKWVQTAESMVTPAPDGTAARFARLWPDSLSSREALQDLGYKAEIGFEQTVDAIFDAHQRRSRL